MEDIKNTLESEYKESIEQQNTPEFDDAQQQIQFKELNDKKHESKKENKEKVKELTLQLEIESFIDRIKNNDGIIDFDSDTMKKIGEGGTHNVFDPDKLGNFIVKINRTVYEESIKGSENGTLNEKSKNMANSFIKNRNNKFENLYKSFGVENCLYETIKLVKIKYQDQIVECPIVIQEKSDLYGQQHISFPAGYIKNIDDEDKNSYENLNNTLLANTGENSISNKDDALMYKINDKLETFMDTITAEGNTILKNKVEEFLGKIKNHYENTGEIIDLVGKDNVMFYQEGENWNFKIGSVIKNTSKKDVDNTLKLLQNNPENFKEETQELNQLNNILAYTRILNYLGIKLGKGKIIDLNLNEQQIKNLNKIGK